MWFEIFVIIGFISIGWGLEKVVDILSDIRDKIEEFTNPGDNYSEYLD